ncbi:hypothetical protein [Nonomuraea sp. B1E8]|uniref:hypothetical protein n=1 Tax=unclassified Nonomuraea TaxID=2593643 RepID=UPI00325C6111
MSTVDFATVLDRLYPGYGDDVRAKMFALMCDVAFVYARSDASCSFDVSLDCALDAVAENVHGIRVQHRLSPLSLLTAVDGDV